MTPRYINNKHVNFNLINLILISTDFYQTRYHPNTSCWMLPKRVALLSYFTGQFQLEKPVQS